MKLCRFELQELGIDSDIHDLVVLKCGQDYALHFFVNFSNCKNCIGF